MDAAGRAGAGDSNFKNTFVFPRARWVSTSHIAGSSSSGLRGGESIGKTTAWDAVVFGVRGKNHSMGCCGKWPGEKTTAYAVVFVPGYAVENDPHAVENHLRTPGLSRCQVGT